jgi:hypothetical protein
MLIFYDILRVGAEIVERHLWEWGRAQYCLKCWIVGRQRAQIGTGLVAETSIDSCKKR